MPKGACLETVVVFTEGVNELWNAGAENRGDKVAFACPGVFGRFGCVFDVKRDAELILKNVSMLRFMSVSAKNNFRPVFRASPPDYPPGA